VLGTAAISFTNVGAVVKEGTGDSGISKTGPVWLQGFAQTGATATTPVMYLYFEDTTLPDNWLIRMGVNYPAGGTTSVDYIISYYSK
jgi:hypothetical protein